MPTALLNIAQTAERLGTTERHIRAMVHRRAIPYVKVGQLLRFDPAALAEWLDAHTVGSSS